MMLESVQEDAVQHHQRFCYMNISLTCSAYQRICNLPNRWINSSLHWWKADDLVAIIFMRNTFALPILLCIKIISRTQGCAEGDEPGSVEQQIQFIKRSTYCVAHHSESVKPLLVHKKKILQKQKRENNEDLYKNTGALSIHIFISFISCSFLQ